MPRFPQSDPSEWLLHGQSLFSAAHNPNPDPNFDSTPLQRGRSGGRAEWRFHVLVTSFEIASRDAAFLKKIKWGVVVVDEGHRLKGGVQGKLYKTLQEFTVGHRVLLTGTPLQNILEELFNLLHFLQPAKFAHVSPQIQILIQTHNKSCRLLAAGIGGLVNEQCKRGAKVICPCLVVLTAQLESFKQEFASMDKEAQLTKLRDQIAPHMLRRSV